MKRTCLLIVCALSTSAHSFSQGKVQLKLDLAEGKTLKYESTSAMKYEGNAMLEGMNQTTMMQMILKTGKKTPKGITVTTSLANIKVVAPGSTQLEETMNSSMKSLQDAKMTAIYDSTGKCYDVKTTGGGEYGQMMSGLSGLNAGFLGMTYPKAPVSIGSKWTAEVDIQKVMGSMAGLKVKKPLTVNYSLKAIQALNGKQVAVVSISINEKLTMDSPEEAGGQSMEMALTSTGEAVCDVATGTLISLVQKVKNEVEMPGGKFAVNIDQSTKLAK